MKEKKKKENTQIKTVKGQNESDSIFW